MLDWAATEARALVTIDTDFGEFLFVESASHHGMVRLPDVPADRRINIMIMAQVLDRFAHELEAGSIITVRRGRIRISKPPQTE